MGFSSAAVFSVGHSYLFQVLYISCSFQLQLFVRNPELQRLTRIKLDTGAKSSYVVRTQPSDACLSTVETIAETLAAVERVPRLAERLCAPLHAMCNYQINHGAVGHDSKEFKAKNGGECVTKNEERTE
jgi:DTW domain-containing protein YfiP